MHICDTLGIERKLIWAATPDQLDQVFAAPIEDRFKALFVAADALFAAQRAQIAEAALRRGLAAFGPWPEDPQAGFLVGHGIDTDEGARAVARYVDKILKGRKACQSSGRTVNAL